LSGSNIHLVWFNFGGGLFYLRSTNNGASWDPTVNLVSGASSPGMPFIAFSGPALHVIWQDQRDGHSAIYYKRNLTGNSGVDVSSGGFDPLTSNLFYSVVPSPFTSFASVPGHSSEHFALYDVYGRKVDVYKGDRIGANLSAGVYFLRPEGKNAKPLRIIKVR